MTDTKEKESGTARRPLSVHWLVSSARQAFLESCGQIRMRWAVIRLAMAVARTASLILLLVNLGSTVLLVAFVYFSSSLLGTLPAAARSGWHSPSGHAAAGYLVAAGLCFIGAQLFGPVRTSLAELVARRVDGVVRDRLAASSLAAAGIAPFEDQELLGDLALARQGLDEGSRTPGQAVSGLATIAGLYAQALFAAALVALFVSPWIGVALLAGALLIRRSHRTGLVRSADARLRHFDLARKAEYQRQVALNGSAGREIRIFALADWLTGRYRELSMNSLAATFAVRRAIHGNRFIPPVLIAAAAAVASLLWVSHQAVNGDIAVRNLVIFLQAGFMCLQVGNYFDEDWQTQWGLVAHGALEAFDKGMAARAEADLARRWHGSRDATAMPQLSLCLSDVSFHYPGSSEVVLNNLSLEIPAGKSLAVVGLNGAGKTTLVKLLAGFYEPSSGAILVDGTDLRELDLWEWQHNVAAIFQDFVRYEFSAAENIAFMDAHVPEKLDAIRWAAEKAGILQALEDLPKGLESPLSSRYRDGSDLSGGQWQRVALARAIYSARRGARVLVLDEPTANLDVRAESEFINQFMDITRGMTTIVISHRFATVRHADSIVVLEGGSVAEKGTHQSLLDMRGRYQRLFQLQAERFADTEEEPEAAR
jgi:ATP-binding cassette, subfamily B, bacterial